MIFDTHTHYDDTRFDEDRETLLGGLRGEGICGITAVGADLASSEKSAALAARFPFVRAAVGVHPDCVGEAETLGEEAFAARLNALAARPGVVAVGEIGLDYYGEDLYTDKVARPVQQRWFRFQLEFLREKGLPGIIHSREAAADTLDIIREEGGADLALVHHCFGYSREIAKIWLDMGHFLGIGGVVTYKNGRKLKEVVQYMPLDRILLETDCPYLAPVPFRGKRNDSRLLPYVVEEIARLKGETEEKVKAVCLENAFRFFRLNKEDFL